LHGAKLRFFQVAVDFRDATPEFNYLLVKVESSLEFNKQKGWHPYKLATHEY